MTRKDHILIAKAFSVARTSCSRELGAGVLFAASNLATYLASDNSRFDREHFLAVVRGEKNFNSRPVRS